MITVSILGCGARGGFTYGKYMHTLKDKYKIVALCDKNPDKIKKYSEMFGISAENCYADEDEFFKERRSDLLIVSTLDTQHVGHALKALKLDYNILLEKPISPIEEECDALLEAEKKSKGKILVCHVLRYTAMIRKMKELLDSGVIGKLIDIDHTERVQYWHLAHSYVRGNWRREDEASPILMAKSCHDLDLLQYFVGSKCKSVSSMGSLAWFKEENAPEGAAKRCVDCKYQDECPYSAKTFYVDNWIKNGKPQAWPYNVPVDEFLTEENLNQAIKEGPYGRCVYHCDNDVYDHQVATLTFENGVHAILRVEGLTYGWGRQILFHGSLGNIYMDQELDTIQVKVYGKPVETIKIADLMKGTADNLGHGGGDVVMCNELYDMITDGTLGTGETSLEASIESHKIAFAADRSAKEGGTLQTIARK